MPETFQTSFIPKTPFAPLPNRVVIDDVHETPGILGIFAYFLLFVSLALSGAALWYRATLSQAIDRDLLLLEKTETMLDQDLLDKVRALDGKINLSERILGRHYSIAYVLDLLGKATTPMVQFESFQFSQTKGDYIIALEGYAKNYNAIAEQSRSFSESVFFKDHLFSDIALDDNKNLVRFKLEVVLPSEEIAFKKIITTTKPMVLPDPTAVIETTATQETAPSLDTNTGFEQIQDLFNEAGDGASATPSTVPVTPAPVAPNN